MTPANVWKGKTVILAAGGTGGHLFPALALAEELRKEGANPVFFSNRLSPALTERIGGFPLYKLPSASPTGDVFAAIGAAGKLALGTLKAWFLMRKLRPAVIVGFGGYPSFPALAAGTLRRVPLMLHEQNAVLGKANKLFLGKAARLALSFPDTAGANGAKAARVTGNPVRAEFFATDAPRSPRTDTIHLFVVGGSQGAASFAALLPAAAGAMREELRGRLRVVQQARREQCASVAAQYGRIGIQAEVAPFFPDIARRLREADIVVSRAGASSLSEIAAVGRASILIPFPYAAENHQTHNARALEAAGACVVLHERGLTPDALKDALEGMILSPATRADMAARARSVAAPDAAKRLAETAAECLG
jgi:UDP-N-acetylglucosamine--N-acetylmuramyl-(pentapeptide) pyrophosphoryl-undecaprenol N-acetylglucosamine transferase